MHLMTLIHSTKNTAGFYPKIGFKDENKFLIDSVGKHPDLKMRSSHLTLPASSPNRENLRVLINANYKK